MLVAVIAGIAGVVSIRKRAESARAAQQAIEARAAKAAELMSAASMSAYFGKYGTDPKGAAERVTELYRQACDLGNWQGCYNLAERYALGLGVAQDLARAATLYHNACDQPQGYGCEDLKRLLCKSNSIGGCP